MANRELSMAQKMFLQSIMHTGFMDSSAVKRNYQKCRERFEEDVPETVVMQELKEFLKDINAQIRPLDMEVRKGFDEDSGLACYVCVNTVDNVCLQGSGKYTLRQMDYFKVLTRLIVISDEGCITIVDALNAVDNLEFKMSKADAAQIIHKDWMMSDKWLKGVTPFDHEQEEGDDENSEDDNTMITLGTRSIVELEGYMREAFSDCVKDCNICNRICIRGLICQFCDCKVHAGCVRSYLQKQKTEVPNCPNKLCGKKRPELLQHRKSKLSQSQMSQKQ